MAQRPRRPKATPSTAADAAQATPADKPVEEGETPAKPDPQPADPAPAEDETPTARSASRRPVGASALPPPADQPAVPDAGVTAEQAGAVELSRDTPAEPEKAGSTDAPDATKAFAEEEGLSPTRRHLGEFEDDEVISAAEPHTASGVTDAYRSPADSHHERPAIAAPAGNGPGLGSLVGAAVGGGVVALLGAWLLSSTGVFGPSTPAEGQSFATTADVDAVSTQLADTRSIVDQLQSAQAAGGSGTSFAPASDVAALSDRLGAVERTLQESGNSQNEAGAQALEAAQAAQNQANDLSGRLDEIGTRVANVETETRQARVALAAAGLKAAIDRGGPFMPELETFAAASDGSPQVDALRDFAAAGVPTQGALLEEWPDVEAQIRTALASEGGTGVGDQILSGLSSLVTVRRTGEASGEGDGPQAALDAMTTALREGDLAAWRQGWDGLDEGAKSVSQDFADKVAARRQAVSVVDEALTNAAANPGTEG
ncbi:COG4223 family protein [Aureimonas mangrovi]|uniref:COG4223 family protein n=1 Tax=Aureimonas mangrovi TaxID=2758041 RepID=UPI00163D416B|nr:hypothetical protein [Aureimonas mangrovi]